jgi:uncharacterized protein YqeY
MTLKEKIQTEFVTAMKAKDDISKSALSGLKAKIIEAEKANGNVSLGDTEIVKVVSSAIKQRNQSVDAFEQAGRSDMAQNEKNEILVLEKFLPTQMTSQGIEKEVREIISEMSEIATNSNALQGKTMGAFNKKFPGQADPKLVMEIIKKVIG